MLSLTEKYDIIISPVHPFAALPHGAIMALENLPGTSYTITYNLTAWPSAVVRGGASPRGLPIGVQIVARPWREDVALAVAQHIETVLGGWQRPPLWGWRALSECAPEPRGAAVDIVGAVALLLYF